jgi:hypothetical protein
MMIEINRQSPVQFTQSPVKTERRDNWTVALEYDGEADGPWLVDLTHKSRWDLQDRDVGQYTPGDLNVPDTPGACAFDGRTLVNRMNATQVSVFHLGASAPALPAAPAYTDVSESTLFVALLGPGTFRVAEKLTNLDFLAPSRQAPFLLQGPFCRVPCQIVTLEKSTSGGGGFVLTCSRGYGDSMVQAILGAGAEFGLRPGGENRFSNWIRGLRE